MNMKHVILSVIGVAITIIITITVMIMIIFPTIENHHSVSNEVITKYNPDEMIDISNYDDNLLFKVYAKKNAYSIVNGEKTWDLVDLELDPAKFTLYKELGNLDNSVNAIVIVPIFTASAYQEPGFYTYYRGDCDTSCLTVELTDDLTWHSSRVAVQALNLLGYKSVTDLDVDKNPEILKQFDKVILLHNEYVTKKEFDAITNHPNVIYLYPNSLYAEVIVNDSTMTLIRGHNYPLSEITNGFDWIHDNTPFEYDYNCANMIFSKISNGMMLNCYPENEILQNPDLLRKIKEL